MPEPTKPSEAPIRSTLTLDDLELLLAEPTTLRTMADVATRFDDRARFARTARCADSPV